MVQFSRRDLSSETDSWPKTKTVSDPNFQVTPTAATATRRQLSHLAKPLDHHAQGSNIPFGVNASLRFAKTMFCRACSCHIWVVSAPLMRVYALAASSMRLWRSCTKLYPPRPNTQCHEFLACYTNEPTCLYPPQTNCSAAVFFAS